MRDGIPEAESHLADIEPGDVVAGLEPDELVEIRRVAPFGNKVLVEGMGATSHREIRRPLTIDELASLEKVRGAIHTFDGDPQAFLLGVEAERIRIAHQFDPLFAVNASIVDPLPHQVDAVYRYLLPLPRIRFLLSDDTGAGKTIMAGLLMKELLFRGVIQKILVVTPGGLTQQWAEEELLGKFGLHARRVNGPAFEADPAQFSRLDEGIFVISVDLIARNETCLQAAAHVAWDLVIVDEAHKLSAYEYGSKLEESARYKAVKKLAQRADHILFLTATPHRGRRDTFRRLLLLLDEDLFQKDEHVAERLKEQVAVDEAHEDRSSGRDTSISRARNRFFLRRLKEEMVDWDGGKLFKPRHTKTVGYNLTPEEERLYDAVTSYVRSKRREAKARRNRNVELTLLVMQRRLASSVYAITRTLENRLRALNEVLAIIRDPSRSAAEKKRLLGSAFDCDSPRDIAEYEELSEDEREATDRRIFRQVLTADPEKVEEERNEIERLYRMALALKHHNEAKFNELLRVLDSSDVIRSEDEKLLIFTEHKDTLHSLEQRLTHRGYTVATIHGEMDVEARKKAQRDFRMRAKVMVATEAAGEGINLQFCRYLINWDIPWNPNRLEQRMGRIHRYGQQEDVWVYNLVAQNTREGAVLFRVLYKLDTMRDQLGDDRVYDVIDEWLEGVPLVALMEKAIDSEDAAEELGTEADEALGEANRSRAEELVALQKTTALASRTDLRAARELRDTSDERRLQPLFIQRFFERTWTAVGGAMLRDEQFPVWHLSATPSVLLELSRKKKMPVPEHFAEPIVFDKQLVSVASKIRVPERTRLLGPGHALFDLMISWAIREARQAFAKGATVVDANLARPHRLWLVRSTVQDGRVEARRRFAHEELAVVVEDHIGKRLTSPGYLLNCLPPAEPVELPDLRERSDEEIQEWAYRDVTEKQLARVTTLRTEECNLRREYLTTAFTDLIVGLQQELADLQQASLFSEDNVEERARLDERLATLRTRKADRLRELDLMMNLTANLPDVITQALVVPAPVAIVEGEEGERDLSRGFPMRRDDEVEDIAMDIAMRYERTRGWTPYDVRWDGEHYDIRSESPKGERRYIEVKGRAQTGPIVITGPELDKLQQLGFRAWLYVVTFCKAECRRLRIIQDPISKLDPEMLYRQVQYLVAQDDWSRHGEEAPVPAEEVAS